MVNFNTQAAQKLSNNVVKCEEKTQLFIKHVVTELNKAPVSDNLKLQDLSALVRYCVHTSEGVLKLNDLGPLKSATLVLPDYSIEFVGMFSKTFHMNIRLHNQGATWKINVDNWAHLLTALEQKCPAYLG